MKTCARCLHKWYPRTASPRRCPNPACATYNWRKPKKWYRKIKTIENGGTK